MPLPDRGSRSPGVPFLAQRRWPNIGARPALLALCGLCAAGPATAQTGNLATPPVGRTAAPQGDRTLAASASAIAAGSVGEALPASLTLEQALSLAEERSPSIAAARASVQAAEARVRQAGFRTNPEVTVEVENFLGTGQLSGFRATETTVAVNQRLDFAGRRRVRVTAAQAELAGQQIRLAIARADLAQEIRQLFARALTARARLELAKSNEARAQELARVAGILVDAGREPPLRRVRARAAAAQAAAEVAAAAAEESGARSSLAALFGARTLPDQVRGPLLDLQPRTFDPAQSLEVRLAEAERASAEAALRQELVARKLDPSVRVGVRHVREVGDVALVAGLSMPIPVFDRNQGNIEAARANVRAAESRRDQAIATSTARARNALASVEGAAARVEALEKAAVPEAAEALRLAERSYREGKASLLELLDAQNAYSTAQAALIDARLAQALATAELGRVAAQ